MGKPLEVINFDYAPAESRLSVLGLFIFLAPVQAPDETTGAGPREGVM
jgi:hypothetical protein